MPGHRLCFCMYYGLFGASVFFCWLLCYCISVTIDLSRPAQPVYSHCSPSLTSFWLFSFGLFFRWHLESLYKVFTPKSHGYLGETALAYTQCGGVGICQCVTSCPGVWLVFHVSSRPFLHEDVAHFFSKLLSSVWVLFFFYCYCGCSPFIIFSITLLARK